MKLFKLIITRYLVQEAFKNQLMILLILLPIFFLQQLVKIFSDQIPRNLILTIIWSGIPEIAQLILPLSLLLSLLFTLSKLYVENEIIVIYACGLSKYVLVKAAMILALLTAAIAAANVMWIKPFSSRHLDKVLEEIKSNPGIAILTQGQFQQIADGNVVLFVESVDGSRFKDIFLAQIHPKSKMRPLIIVAESGQLIQHKDGSQIIVLNKGTCFEGTAMLRDFRITNFKNYQATIGHQTIVFNSSDTDKMNIYTLIKNTNNNRAKADLHWRIALIFSVFIMALMVIPISAFNPHYGRFMSMLPAMLLYMVFFLLQTAIKSNGSKGKIDPMIWSWTINSIYSLLVIWLYLWDIVPMRRLRDRFMHQGRNV